ncbi:MAG: hypothetical protein J2P46_02755 [Zavarzinella sp.]|nr:hypothetical protein [Zavarzinella sp.]
MARISVTAYEWEHDLLPDVCAKCGAPAAERPVRIARMLDDKRFWVVCLFLFGLFFFPPLVVLVIFKLSKATPVRVPVCADHRNDWVWRDWAMRWALVPVWITVVTGVEAYGVWVQAVEGRNASAFFCVGMSAVAAAIAIEKLVILRGAVRVEQPRKDEVRLSGVHEEFAAAFLEERARDRVDNPARRSLRGDIHDDFDDEPV